jgi:REP element-mobilizing transposase RayT
MSTYTQILYQIVFSTKHREPTLTKQNREELFRFIWGILEKKNCHLYRINGVEDHLHILTHIHPTISLSSLVKDIKVSSALHIKNQKLFNNFNSWQEGYGAFSYNIKEKGRLIDYVKNQEEHHQKIDFKDEYIQLLKENEIEFEERYLL